MRQCRDAGSCLRHSLQFGRSSGMPVCMRRAQYVSDVFSRSHREILRSRKVFKQRTCCRSGCRSFEKGLQLWKCDRSHLLELVASTRDLLLELRQIVDHAPQRCSVRIHQQHGLKRELFTRQLVKKARPTHQSGIGVVSLRLAAENLLAVVLDGTVVDLEDPVTLAEQVQKHRQPITAGRLKQDQEVARMWGVAIEITLEPTESGGIAGKMDRLHTFPR